jgi:hypothetical protein
VWRLNPDFYFWGLHHVACIITIFLGVPSIATIFF